MFVPKLFTTLKGYTRTQFTADLTAGVIVGIVALPLAVAFAIASGVTPDRGLWTAIVAGFLISALGGSRVQIGGPTGYCRSRRSPLSLAVRARLGLAMLVITMPLPSALAQDPGRVGAPSSIDTFATLRVTVTHEGTPVTGALVRSDRVGALVDARGMAVLRLVPGPHRVVTSRVGLVPDTTGLVLRAGQDTALVISLEERTHALEEVRVSSTRGERRIEDEPVRVEVLGQEEVEEKLLMTPGDISMLLNETAGLRVQTTSPSLGGANVRIQGLAGRYTQILSDGLPLFGGQAGALGLLQIPPMDIRQVEVIKGAASALYGSSALGGVVNLVSRRPGEEAAHELLLNQTSRGGTDAIVYLSAPLTERWGYTMLGGMHLQDERDLDADAWADMAGYRRTVLRPRFFWDTERGQSLLVTAGATVEEREGGTLDGGAAPDGAPWIEALNTRRLDLGAVGRFLVGANLWRVRGSATEQRHEHRFGSEREDDRHRTGFVEATFTVPRERVSWLFGAALQRESYENVQVQGFDHTFTTGSAFAQADLTPTPWLAVAATARVDEHSAYGTLLNPRVSVLLRAPENGRLRDWTLRASAGTGAFTPTPFTEETEVVGLRALAPWSPDDLDVERATTGSLDLGGPLGPLEVNATLFASVVRDPIATREELLPDNSSRLRLMNAPEATRTAGTELLARYLAEPWHVTGSYTYTRSTAWDIDDGARRAAPLVPRHSVGVVGMYEVEDRGRIGLELYYTGRQVLEHNPYRDRSRPYLIIGALLERHVGRARLFVNFENLTNVRQTRWDPLVLPSRGRGGRWTTDAWTELAGRTVNGGVRYSF